MNVTTVQTVDVGRPLTLEIWDFSGTPACAEEVKKRLISGFFHAAVLCYSAEDPASLSAVEREVSTHIQPTHTLCVVFTVADNVRVLVEAAARAHTDRVPAHSGDGVEEGFAGGRRDDAAGMFSRFAILLFLEKRLTWTQGTSMAAKLGAVAFAECSAVTGEGVDPAWKYLCEVAVRRLDQGQRAITRGRRKEKTREAVKEAGKTMVKAFTGFFRRWGKGTGSSA